MLTPAQLRAARALLGIDQRTLAERAGVSLPTIQRREAASDGYVRGVVDTLTKVGDAREREVLEGRYGLHDREPETLEVLSVRRGLTRERVRQIEREALRKLYDVMCGEKPDNQNGPAECA